MRKTKTAVLLIVIFVIAALAFGIKLLAESIKTFGTRGEGYVSISPVERSGMVLSCGTKYDAEELFDVSGAGDNANYSLYAEWIAVPEYERHEGIEISEDGRHIVANEDHGYLWIRLCVWNDGESGYGDVCHFTADAN